MPDDPIAFFINGESLAIFGGKVDQDKFVFPAGVVQFSEVADKEKFKTAFKEFLTKAAVSQSNAVIVLSEDLVFTKKEEVLPEKEKEFRDNFLSNIPHASLNIALLIFRDGKNLELFAADKSLYELISGVLLENGTKVNSVLPLQILSGITNTKEPDQTEIMKALKDNDVIDKYNFLKSREETGEEVTPAEDGEPRKNRNIQYIYLSVSILFFGLAILYLLSTFGIFAQKKAVIKPVSKQTITTQATPSAAPVLKSDKAALKIDILNGSGVAGQAGKLSDALKAIGFQNIQTGNAEASSGATQIDFKPDVDKNLINQIASELKESLTNVATKEAMLSGDFDVVITTAK